ncbi:hypothetical protein VTN77DRAFT_526 [Rasamsonia byssochlamydoides]|uniref:uncharacterized protein n=1 Tax=Rasamsonia byssochlamydoides TaxID=89139 RepID=UPI003743746C
MFFAGIVDLCPCIRFTFRDKLRFVEQLKKSSNNNNDSSHSHTRDTDTGPYTFRDFNPGEHHHFWHQCSTVDPHRWVVWVKIVPVLKSGYLLIQTQYDITPLQSNNNNDNENWWQFPTTSLNGLEILCCRDNGVSRYCYYRTPPAEEERHNCDFCLTSVEYASVPGPHQYSLRVTRNLGQEGQADLVWSHQCVLKDWREADRVLEEATLYIYTHRRKHKHTTPNCWNLLCHN